MAGTTGTAAEGAMLLFVYSLGLAIPFLLVATIFERALAPDGLLARSTPYIARVGGVLLVIMGILLVVDQYGVVNVLFTALHRILGGDALMNYL
jgi:cytochrome c-type biogenesis protein